jgi:hypothetical protein
VYIELAGGLTLGGPLTDQLPNLTNIVGCQFGPLVLFAAQRGSMSVLVLMVTAPGVIPKV